MMPGSWLLVVICSFSFAQTLLSIRIDEKWFFTPTNTKREANEQRTTNN